MSGKAHFEICVEADFSAAHHLRGYPGDCERPHGHNWTVEVRVECDALDEVGIGIDFRDVKAAVKEAVRQFDHTDLNELEPFRDENPTSENIARFLYQSLSPRLTAKGVRLTKLRVSESTTCGVWYWED
jgi:6-pyruvoyltetrahydropterin/6-carboxytetrahydropterin synthase